nr:asparaginase [Frankia sp. Cr1]
MAVSPGMPGRRVIVYGLGGTIAMTAAGSDGVAPTLSTAQLVASVPGLAATGIGVEVEDFRRLPGASLTFDDITALAQSVHELTTADPGIDGVVVVQGTDTIEETAYLLDLLHPEACPVVVTGAMRPPQLAGADGPANLLAAIAVAANPHTGDQGCLVVLADEIHAARRVRKTHTSAGATFRSPTGGPLGYLVEGQPRMVNRLTHRTVLPRPAAGSPPPRVALVTIVLGDDGLLLEHLPGHLDGLVVAAFGVGHVPAALVPLLDTLARRIPVVLASRTGAGSVAAATYGFPGSERDLLGRGLISAGFLDPLKARILLHTLLTAGSDRPTMTAAFGVAGGYTDPARWPWPRPGRTDSQPRSPGCVATN